MPYVGSNPTLSTTQIMNNKHIENINGDYYVTLDCIACDTCVNVAVNHFKLTADNDHAFVHNQPRTEAEQQACQKAKSDCPVEAIQTLSDNR